MNTGRYTFSAPAALIRTSTSACIRSQIAYAYGRMTIVPRTGPLSASAAFSRTSWYQRGLSSFWDASTQGRFDVVMARMVTGGRQGPAARRPRDRKDALLGKK